MKLLITGASGLFGSKLCELAVWKKHEVYSAYFQHEPIHGIPVQLDISNRKTIEKMLEKMKPEAVVHGAALTDVDRCELEKDLAWKINAEGTRSMAELCERHRFFLVYISTDYVFAGEKGMYEEIDKPSPINYYGLTKLKGEESVENLMSEYCIARTSVVYGSILATGKVNFALWVLHKLKKNEKVKVVTDQWNSPTLNANLANMVLEILKRKITGIFHLAGATRLSRYEFAELLAGTFRLDADLIRPVSSEDLSWIAERPKDSSLNVDKAYRILNSKPLEIQEALKKMKKRQNNQAVYTQSKVFNSSFSS